MGFFARGLIAVILCILGMTLAVPLSYVFQIEVMQVMSMWDYVTHFPLVQLNAATFGAWDIYRNTAMSLIVVFIVGFNVIDGIKQRKKQSDKSVK